MNSTRSRSLDIEANKQPTTKARIHRRGAARHERAVADASAKLEQDVVGGHSGLYLELTDNLDVLHPDLAEGEAFARVIRADPRPKALSENGAELHV